MPHKISNTSLVRKYIRDLIVSQGLKPGDKLPCEGDIAAALDISKSCVREATRALESIGLIEIRHGIGLVLRNFNLDAIGDIFDYGFVLDPSIVIDLYDLRRQLETSLMSRVVAKIDDAQIKCCDDILHEWKQLAEKNEPIYKIDGQFHETLYSVVDNRMLTSLCNIFWDTYRDLEMNQLLEREFPTNADDALITLEQHQRILDAVRSHDGTLATKLMYEHFRKIERRPAEAKP